MAEFFLPLLGGVVGAWAGAHFALARFKEERVFDRRLEWIERVVRKARNTRFRLAGAKRAMKADDRDSAKDALKQAHELSLDTLRTTHEGRMYANPSAWSVLQELQDRIDQLEGPPADRDAVIETTEELEELFTDLYRELSKEARSIQGLDPLE